MNTTVDTVINGLRQNVGREVKQKIQANPSGDIALPCYETTVEWVSGYQTRTGLKDNSVVLGDEPPQYGGEGKGASPQELLLTSIGNCLVATFVGGLSAADIDIKHLAVEVSGQVNFAAAFGVKPGHPGFLAINAIVRIQTNAEAKKVEKLLQRLYPTAPIPATVLQPTPIHLSFEHV